MNLPVKVYQRDVKYPRIEIKNFETRVILPFNYNISVDKILDKYKKFLEKKYKYISEVESLSRSLSLVKNENYKDDIFKYVYEFANKLKVKPKGIFFRKMKKRWGSCSKDGKLIFNKNMIYLPKNLVRYIVCHEVCHLVEKNHKDKFFELMSKFYKRHTYYRNLLDSYMLAIFRSKHL